MIMTIGDRFKKTRDSLGLNQSELARELGVNPSIISDIERGDKEPSKKIISSLIVKYQINSNWILTGQGEMLIKQQDKAEKHPLITDIEAITAPRFECIESRLTALERLVGRGNPVPGEYPEEKVTKDNFTSEPEAEYIVEKQILVPYVHDIAAGPPIQQSEDQSQQVRVPARLVKKGSRYYAASVRGGSMVEAGIRDGDTVLIRCDEAPRDGAIQVVRYKRKSTLKRLREVEGGGWELHYEDGTGRVIPVDSGQYEVQGDFTAILPKNSVPD